MGIQHTACQQFSRFEARPAERLVQINALILSGQAGYRSSAVALSTVLRKILNAE